VGKPIELDEDAHQNADINQNRLRTGWSAAHKPVKTPRVLNRNWALAQTIILQRVVSRDRKQPDETGLAACNLAVGNEATVGHGNEDWQRSSGQRDRSAP